MRNKQKQHRWLSLLLAAVMLFSIVPTAFAAQGSDYHDPAEHWKTSNNRTVELDANAHVSHETFFCAECGMNTSFTVWRTPEYTRDGKTALTRNVLYSDGTMTDGSTKGNILDGTPGKDAFYTGYHFTKSMCDTCGTLNSNDGKATYSYNRNVYRLYDCAHEFMEELDETVSVEYADDTYHSVTTKGGEYCVFCYGTRHTEKTELVRHDLHTDILPQLGHQRFAVVKHCEACKYSEYSFIAAKSVVADYYGVADGKPHTISISDLSESGVSAVIRYGNSADTCNMTSAPNFTEAGEYAVYYAITYSYKGESMTENGVANVWLREEKTDKDGSCACGCGEKNCGCQDKDCNGKDCCNHGKCGENHSFVLLESVKPTCLTLGYDRYLCSTCGKIEKRDYKNATGHSYQSIAIRDATCEADGKIMEICKGCGDAKVTTTPKGEHHYKTVTVKASCTSPGYTVKECSVCGDRHIIDVTDALPHNHKANTIPATCESGGKTVHTCEGCGSSFTTDYTQPLGHSFDKGTKVTSSTCGGEGIMEYHCVRCGYHYLEGISAEGHKPGAEATCTEAQLCTVCGVVLASPLGHDYKGEATAPTCTKMGYVTYTCSRCRDSHKGDYTVPTGHKSTDWIVDKEPTTETEGEKHIECETCHTVLEKAVIEKIYLSSVTDGKGEAVVGGYLVIVSDTDSKAPVAGASVLLTRDNTLAIRLPDARLLDYGDQTTVTVLLVKDKSPVSDMFVAVSDGNDNYSAGKTDAAGQITVPTGSGYTNDGGKVTAGHEDEDGNRYTLTVKVEHYDTGRPIPGAAVSIGRTGNITVILPDGTEMNKNHRITVIVTDNKHTPQEGVTVTVKNDLGSAAKGDTDKNGELTVPAAALTVKHGAYIVGYPDGTFGPERSMTRAEAAAIFARLLSERRSDAIPTVANTRFEDVPADSWYSGYVQYLNRLGIVSGITEKTYEPDKAVTRAEFTTMAVRFFDVYGDGAAEIMEEYKSFSDISTGYWAAKYINAAATHGWIVGYSDGTFGPERSITRAEVVTLVNRLLDRAADEAYIRAGRDRLVTFTDMQPGHWAYLAVMEASNAHTADMTRGESWSK